MNDDELKQQELEEEELRHSIDHLKEAQQKLGELAKASKERREMMKKTAASVVEMRPPSNPTPASAAATVSPQENATLDHTSISEKEPQPQHSRTGQDSTISKQSEAAQVHTGDTVLKENFQSLHSK
jgi:hypothetical protein